MMTSTQNHPQYHPRNPLHGYSRNHQQQQQQQQQNQNQCALPLPRSKHRRHQRGSLQNIENRNGLNVSTTRNGSQTKQPRKQRLRQNRSGSPSTSFSPPKIQRQSHFEGAPNANDVVCFQPNSTHEGNLRFGVVARNFANYYKRVTDVVTANSSASMGSTSKRIQKQIVLSIVAEVQSRGGRFLVWVKRKSWGNSSSEDPNNGYWTLVSPEHVFRISRCALLKEAEALEREALAELQHEIEHEIEIKPPPGFSRTPSSEHYESSSNNNNCIDRSESNTCTILNMLSEMSVDSDDDSLDAWSTSTSTSTSSTTDDNCTEHPAASCWEYKLLIPQAMQ